jgi:hypothetical protein
MRRVYSRQSVVLVIHAYQEKFFSPNLDRVFRFAQINIWGRVDPDLSHVYEPLWSLDEKGAAEVRKINAETGQIHIDSGVIAPGEERERITNDPETPYQGLDPDNVPDLREEEEEGLEPSERHGGPEDRLGEGQSADA